MSANPTSSLRIILISPVAALVLLMAACAGGGTQLSPVVPTSLVITSASASQAIGETQQLSATALFSDSSRRDVTAQSTWTSSVTATATVTPSGGLEKAIAAGDAVISATFSFSGTSVIASVPLHVQADIVSIVIEPAVAQLELGANQRFAATATLGDGSTLDVTRSAVWTSSDESVLRINTTAGREGLGNTRGPGRVIVSATVEGIQRSTSASVTRRAPKFLYVGGTNGINGYSITPTTGAITPVRNAQFTAVGAIASLTISRDRQFLYAADSVLGVIWAFSIDASGALVPVPNSPFFTQLTSSPISVVADPADDVLFMTDVDTGDITTFSINQDGSLTAAAPGTAVGRLPLFATATPDGKFFYQALHVGSSASIKTFSIGANGTLSPLGAPAVEVGFLPHTLTVDPSGQFLYAAVPSSSLGPSNSVFAFSIDATTGALTPIQGAPFSAGQSPVSLAAHPSGRFLYAVNSANSADGNSISIFSLDSATGSLSHVEAPVPAANSPSTVIADPAGLFLYVGLGDGQGVRVFAIDQQTGALTEAVVSPVPALGPIQAIATSF